MILFSSIVINNKGNFYFVFMSWLSFVFSFFSTLFLFLDLWWACERLPNHKYTEDWWFQRYSLEIFSSSRRINSHLPTAWWSNATADWDRSQDLCVQRLRNTVESIRFSLIFSNSSKFSFLFFSFLFYRLNPSLSNILFFRPIVNTIPSIVNTTTNNKK